MTPLSKIRVATNDTAHALDLACCEVESAVGLPVRPEFQEIEGECLILELLLGEESVHSPHPSRLAAAVERCAPGVEVLSSWQELPMLHPAPKYCDDVVGVPSDALPEVADRALIDNLPTACWERADLAWRLAVPSIGGGRRTVALAHRHGYSLRFTAVEAAAIRVGLAC